MCGVVETEDKPHKPCSKCKVAYYCSVLCQKQHWKEGGHKQQCGGGDSSSSRGGSGAADAPTPEEEVLAPKKCVPDPELEERFNRAMLQFAKLTERGEDSREKADCLKTIKEVASKGLAAAQYNLGIIHHTGQGVPQSDALAVEWYRKAADQGNIYAQYNLGYKYRDGSVGLPQSDALAVEWFRKAADQGCADAQNDLGVMYADGCGGLPKSYSTALWWARKAQAQGLERATGFIDQLLRVQHVKQAAAAAASPPAPPSTSSLSPIPIGTRVELHGLKAKKLNRQRGEMVGFVASSGRCEVKLDDGRGPYSLKAENLKKMK